MANRYPSLNNHLVVSTKNRGLWLIESICERLWPYLGRIPCEHGMKPVINIFGNNTMTLMTVTVR